MATRIIPSLWFDDQAEQAVSDYTGIFPNSRIGSVARYTEAGQDIHGRLPGSVMTLDFELDGYPFTALNGGPMFKFTEAVSLQVMCKTQGEVDHYWTRLSVGGDPSAQQCGWVKDKYGLSWQIVPEILIELAQSPDRAKAARVITAMMAMKKLDIAALEKAHAGTA